MTQEQFIEAVNLAVKPLETKIAELEQKLADQELKQSERPAGGRGNPSKEATEKECDEIAGRLLRF